MHQWNTLFAGLDAVATIYFIARVCAAFIQERRLFESRVYSISERQSVEKLSLDTAKLKDSDPFADVEG